MDPSSPLKLIANCENCEGQNVKEMVFKWRSFEEVSENKYIETTNRTSTKVSTDINKDKNFASEKGCFTPGK